VFQALFGFLQPRRAQRFCSRDERQRQAPANNPKSSHAVKVISKQARLQLLSCVGAVFVFAVFLASQELWRRLITESGKTMGTYVLTGHPTVQVKMFSFLQGRTFQVVTDTEGKPTQIFSEIWSLPPNGGKSIPSDSVFCQEMREAKTTSDGGAPYEVYWTQDGTKCAIALHSHLIAAFDTRSGAKIEYTGEQYENFHPRIRSFLSR
jgi:hypothetical protein